MSSNILMVELTDEHIAHIIGTIMAECVIPFAAAGGTDFSQITARCRRCAIEQLLRRIPEGFRVTENSPGIVTEVNNIMDALNKNVGTTFAADRELYARSAGSSGAEIGAGFLAANALFGTAVIERCQARFAERPLQSNADAGTRERWCARIVDPLLAGLYTDDNVTLDAARQALVSARQKMMTAADAELSRLIAQ